MEWLSFADTDGQRLHVRKDAILSISVQHKTIRIEYFSRGYTTITFGSEEALKKAYEYTVDALALDGGDSDSDSDEDEVRQQKVRAAQENPDVFGRLSPEDVKKIWEGLRNFP
jgi:hypothetical protein